LPKRLRLEKRLSRSLFIVLLHYLFCVSFLSSSTVPFLDQYRRRRYIGTTHFLLVVIVRIMQNLFQKNQNQNTSIDRIRALNGRSNDKHRRIGNRRTMRIKKNANNNSSSSSSRRRTESSSALASSSSSSSTPKTDDDEEKTIVVVGAGWAGWGAAKALSEANVKVILLDGLSDPTGRTKDVTESGKPFEAGVRGFWKDYPNIYNLVTEYLELREEDVFTEYTRSSFYSPDGLEATAPVFAGADLLLPSPLGQVFATFDNFKRLPIQDRASMIGLLYAVVDLNRNEKVFEKYDRATAHELFAKTGVSKRLVDDFLKPTLLVGLFKPPEELSAAVTMELLYYYALAHQDSFDVRWIKSKSIAEMIVAPMAEKLQKEHDLDVRGGCFVKSLNFKNGDKSRVDSITYFDTKLKKEIDIDCVDGVVLALGAKGLKQVISNSPELAKNAPELTAASSLGAIDVCSVRLWLDKYVATDTPANVFSRFDALRGAGGTFFMLDQNQKDSENELWGNKDPRGSVVACDFYNSSSIATLSDEDIVKTLMNELLPECVEAFRDANVVDSCVRRYPQAVSHFSPGSFSKRPPLQTSIDNVVCAGDWVRLGDREFGAKGLCQERAFVTGIEAANELVFKTFGKAASEAKKHPVIPIRADELQVVLSTAVNKRVLEGVDDMLSVFSDGAFNVFGFR
jgi:uncharacterized protein with NAD-binding domain and iron-sulfur cluster